MPSLSRSALLCATAVAVAAQSHSPDHDPVALSHVVVTAHPYARTQGDVAQPTSVLSGRALDLRQASSLGELLSAETGVSSSWFGPGASRPIIRGLGGDRLRVLQNGVGTIDASVTSPDHAVALDPLLIERVEIVRGPASLLYGSSAVGGVVNVITHRIHESVPWARAEGRAEVRLASVNDERSGGVVLEGGTGRIAWHADAYRRQSDDVRIPGVAAHDAPGERAGRPGRIPNTALAADGGAFGVTFVDERGRIGVAFSGHNAFYGVPPGAHAHAEEEEPPGADEEAHGEEAVRIDLQQRRVDLEGEWLVPTDLLRSVRLKASHGDYRHQELEGAEVGTVFRTDGSEVRLELLHDALGGFTGALGVQASRQELSAAGDEAFLPPSRTHQQAVFWFEEAKTGFATWQLGLRAERQDIDVQDDRTGGREDASMSASLGAVRPLAEHWSIAVSLARTQRPPNAQELFADGPHVGTNAYEIGDRTLRREASTGVDVSLRRGGGRVTGELTLFANRFDGFVSAEPTEEPAVDGLPVYRFGQRDAEFVGGELDVVVHLHETGSQRLDLSLGADVVRGRHTDAGTHLPRITPARIRLGVDWAAHGFIAGGELQRAQAQHRTAPAESPTDGYTLLSVYAGRRWLTRRATFDLTVRATNLTDEEARVHTSLLKDVAPLPGRNLSVTLRTSF